MHVSGGKRKFLSAGVLCGCETRQWGITMKRDYALYSAVNRETIRQQRIQVSYEWFSDSSDNNPTSSVLNLLELFHNTQGQTREKGLK